MTRAGNIHFSRSGSRDSLFSGRLSSFVDLWHAIADDSAEGPDKQVPTKASFSIKRLRPFLPSYFLAEWTGADLLNRLVGSEFDRDFGHSLTGQSFLASYQGAQRQYFHDFWRQLIDHPCGVITGRTLHLEDARTLRLKGVSLPLADQDGAVRYLCGIGDIAREYRDEDVSPRGRAVYIDHVEYLDLGFGLPACLPDPAVFNAAVA